MGLRSQLPFYILETIAIQTKKVAMRNVLSKLTNFAGQQAIFVPNDVSPLCFGIFDILIANTPF